LKVLQNVNIFLPYIMAARTAGIDKNEEILSLSTYVYASVTHRHTQSHRRTDDGRPV